MSCTGPAHELPTENLYGKTRTVLLLPRKWNGFPLEADTSFASTSQRSIICFLRVRQTSRLWTTARFRESILPKWTREQDFQSRFARNTHHSNIFLLDICDAITFLLWPSCHHAVSKLHFVAFWIYTIVIYTIVICTTQLWTTLFWITQL